MGERKVIQRRKNDVITSARRAKYNSNPFSQTRDYRLKVNLVNTTYGCVNRLDYNKYAHRTPFDGTEESRQEVLKLSRGYDKIYPRRFWIAMLVPVRSVGTMKFYAYRSLEELFINKLCGKCIIDVVCNIEGLCRIIYANGDVIRIMYISDIGYDIVNKIAIHDADEQHCIKSADIFISNVLLKEGIVFNGGAEFLTVKESIKPRRMRKRLS